MAQPEPFTPTCLNPDATIKVCGGGIIFVGDIPLYKNGHIVRGLGISDDTPCAHHEIPMRVHPYAGLAPAKGQLTDAPQYTTAGSPSIYAHPISPNTYRNGQEIGG
jgi:hypothetical protein